MLTPTFLCFSKNFYPPPLATEIIASIFFAIEVSKNFMQYTGKTWVAATDNFPPIFPYWFKFFRIPSSKSQMNRPEWVYCILGRQISEAEKLLEIREKFHWLIQNSHEIQSQVFSKTLNVKNYIIIILDT